MSPTPRSGLRKRVEKQSPADLAAAFDELFAANAKAVLYVMLAARAESPYVAGAMVASDGGITISI